MLAWHTTTLSAPPAGRSSTAPPASNGVDARLAPLMASLTARLGAVCRHWESAEFAALVERIARTQLRWADRGDVA